MSRLIDAIEAFGEWTVDFAEGFNDGVVDAVERIARVPARTSAWSLSGVSRALVAFGRAVGSALRIAMFYLPAGIVALTGHLTDRPAWLVGSGVYAVLVTAVGVAGHIRQSRAVQQYS